MHTVSSLLTILYGLLIFVGGVGFAVCGYFIASGLVKRATLEILKTTNDALTTAATERDGRILELTAKSVDTAKTLKRMNSRLFLNEVARERDEKRYKALQDEMGLMERMLQISFEALTKANAKEPIERINQLQAQLIKSRQRAEDDIQQWERMKQSALAYMDAEGKDALGEHASTEGAQLHFAIEGDLHK